MRIRTIREAHKELRAADPRCGLGISALYRMVKDGMIPSSRVGVKYLIDLDCLEDYLSQGGSDVRGA